MLPTPSWSRLKKWRLKRAAGGEQSKLRQKQREEIKADEANPSQPSAIHATSTNYHQAAANVIEVVELRHQCRATNRARSPEVASAGVRVEEIEEEGKEEVEVEVEEEKEEKVYHLRQDCKHRLAALIPRTFSTLLNRATSPRARQKAGRTSKTTRPVDLSQRPEVALGVAKVPVEQLEAVAMVVPSQRAPSSGSGEQDNECHLTARTRDNQCALHGSSSSLLLQQQQQNNGLQQANNGNGSSECSKKLTSKTVTTTTTSARSSPRDRAKGVPTWPLAKQTLDNNLPSELRLGHFGDCEDLLSAHLAGRLFGALAAQDVRLTDQLRAFNYNHKRPFGATYEWPPTGWLQSATGEPATRAGSLARSKAKLFAASTGGYRRRSYDDRQGDHDYRMIVEEELEQRKAKLKFAQFADQQQEQNDYQQQPQNENQQQQQQQPIQLQLQQRTIKTRTISRTLRGTRRKSSGEKLCALSSLFAGGDVKLAKCLLDQDYNQTVRLFVAKSALNWNFNAFTFDALCCGRSLTELLIHLFDYYQFRQVFNLDIVKLLKCFRLLEFGYHSTNPYHNSVHAADVTQAMHCFIQEQTIRKHMTPVEILSSILAAVCHDLDHPGVNQSFLIATGNPLAQLYHKTSVLENHHWRFALCIFKEARVFDHFEPKMLADMQDQLKQLILATDIARQNDYLKRFKELTQTPTFNTTSHTQNKRTFSMTNAQDRALVLQMALKCADLGNPCRPWLISRVWSNLICEEFYRMGAIERRLNLPLTPICQRHKSSIAGIQTDFFKFIVLPLLELWHGFLGSPLSRLLMTNFEHNYQRWQRANRIETNRRSSK